MPDYIYINFVNRAVHGGTSVTQIFNSVIRVLRFLRGTIVFKGLLSLSSWVTAVPRCPCFLHQKFTTGME